MEYLDQIKDKEFLVHQNKLTGSGYFNEVYSMIYAIEQSKELKKISQLNFGNLIRTDKEGVPLFLVSFEMTAQVYHSIDSRFAAATTLENNLTAGPLYDAFYPLIRNEMPPNVDNLLDVQGAKLLALIPEGAFVADTKGNTYLVCEGEQVYDAEKRSLFAARFGFGAFLDGYQKEKSMFKPVVKITTLVTLIFLIVGCGPVGTATPTTPLISPPPAHSPTATTLPYHGSKNMLVAFSSDQDGDFEIWVMNADGSDQRNLTDNNAMDVSPSWSPDGSQIAFVSNRDGNDEIYIMNPPMEAMFAA